MFFHRQSSMHAGIVTTLASRAVAQGFDYVEISGVGDGQTQNNQLFEDAAKTPIRTADYPFGSFNLSAVVGTISGGGAQWHWNINLTTVNAHDASIGADAEVTSVVYDLGLDTAESPSVEDFGWQLCASVLIADFPEEIRTLNDSVQGDCSLVLGNECYAAWSSSFDALGTDGNCEVPPSWTNIPECARLAEMSIQWNSFSLVDFYDEDGSRGLRNREAFYYQSTAAHSPSESDGIIAAEAAKIRMMILAQSPGPNNPEGGAAARSTMCLTFKSVDTENFDNVDESTSDDKPRDAAVIGNSISSTMVMGVAFLAMAMLV